MTCPNCKRENPDELSFCKHCHYPFHFVCPVCSHVQSHGAKCDKCGIDIEKYAEAQVTGLEEATKLSRDTKTHRILASAGSLDGFLFPSVDLKSASASVFKELRDAEKKEKKK